MNIKREHRREKKEQKQDRIKRQKREKKNQCQPAVRAHYLWKLTPTTSNVGGDSNLNNQLKVVPDISAPLSLTISLSSRYYYN
jgi:hypothetical protein